MVTYLSHMEMHHITGRDPSLLSSVNLKMIQLQMIHTCRAFDVVLANVCSTRTRTPICRTCCLDIINRYYDAIQSQVEELAETYSKDMVHA